MLPRIVLPTHTANYNIKGFEKIEYTPWNNSIQQILLMAKDSDVVEKVNSYHDAIKFSVKDVDVNKIPYFILIDLLIKCKAVSSSNTVDLEIKCSGSDCDKKLPYTFDLNSYELEYPEGLKNQFTINDITFSLRYPTYEELNTLEGKELLEVLLDTCCTKDEVFDVVNASKIEIGEFIDSLPPYLIEEIKNEFFANMPRLHKKVEFTCPHCGTHNTVDFSNVLGVFI